MLNVTTEQELATALADGLLEETHYLDVKRQLNDGKEANEELGRDLASFAVDGGQLIFGVWEKKDAPAELYPIDLTGLPERIDQVARARVDPPLGVRTRAIPSEADATRGYLIVTIPPSPTPPHQVAGTYWGRSDKTKYAMPASEVARQHERRAEWARGALPALTQLMANDPVPLASRKAGHLFVYAAPVAPNTPLLAPLIADPRGWVLCRQIIDSTTAGADNDFAPTANDAHTWAPTARGIAFFSSDFQSAAQTKDDPFEAGQIRVELIESGAVEVFCGRGTDTRIDYPNGLVMDELAVVWCFRVLGMVRRIGAVASFAGSWDLGLGISGLKDKPALSRANIQGQRPPFTEEAYLRVERATTEQIEANPTAVVERLTGRLLLALGSRHIQAITDLLPVVDPNG